MIPFLDLKNTNRLYMDEIETAVAEVLKSGWFILGEKVKKFENEFSDYCNVKNTIGTANGLDALILIFRAYKEMGVLNDGDEVLVPSNTYIAPFSLSDVAPTAGGGGGVPTNDGTLNTILLLQQLQQLLQPLFLYFSGYPAISGVLYFS